MFLSSRDKYIGEFLELHLKGVRPFQAQEEGGISRDAAGKRASFCVEGRIYWFLSKVATGNLGFPPEFHGDLQGPFL